MQISKKMENDGTKLIFCLFKIFYVKVLKLLPQVSRLYAAYYHSHGYDRGPFPASTFSDLDSMVLLSINQDLGSTLNKLG